ncbi:MAG: uracil-DNA glycosylase [Pikeienuella sp.]
MATTEAPCPAPQPPAEPLPDCRLCPRLADFRDHWRASEPNWFNGPVPSFGDPAARLLVVGLAPGLRGANRTGRPFTGDWAGELLYTRLIAHGFARGPYGADPADGLTLQGCMVSNAVRCVPPQNKPIAAEIAACRPFLAARIAALPRLTHILTLGRIAHESTVRALGLKPAAAPFAHGGVALIGRLSVHASYHCSRYNTNTGRLTPEMFDAVLARIAEDLSST